MTTKFYSPLSVQALMTAPDGEQDYNEVFSDIQYQNEIDKAILNDRRRFFYDPLRMRVYNYEVSELIGKMYAYVERHGQSLWGVTAVEHSQPFSEAQVNDLKAYIKDQYEHGWGEEFEQKNIEIADNPSRYNIEAVNVYFYTGNGSFVLMTKDEFNAYLQEKHHTVEDSSLRISAKIIYNDNIVAACFPMNAYKLEQIKCEAGIDIPEAEYKIEITELWGARDFYPRFLNTDGVSMEELNFLTQRINLMNKYDSRIFENCMEHRNTLMTVQDAINMTYNMDDIHCIYFGNDEVLGEWVLNSEMESELTELSDTVYDLLDAEKVGERFRKANEDIYRSGYYIEIPPKEEWNCPYDGKQLPEHEKPLLFCVRIGTSEQDNTWIDLPITDKEKYRYAMTFQKEELESLNLYGYKTMIPQLSKVDVGIQDIDMLSDMAREFEQLSPEEMVKYKATLEVMQPSSIEDAKNILNLLDEFKLDTTLTHPEDYARLRLAEKLDIPDDDSFFETVYLREAGINLMEKDGLIHTHYGAVTLPYDLELIQSGNPPEIGVMSP